MLLTKAVKRNIALFIGSFFLLGILRILLYAKDFATGFTQLFVCALALLWGVFLRRRIMDGRLRGLMLGVAAALFLQNLLQFSRYDLFAGISGLSRHLWYAYYIPMTAVPLLSFFIALSIHRPADKPLPRWIILPLFIGVLLALGFFNNDLHFLAVSFPSGILDDNGLEKSGPLFYIINIFIYGMYIIAFYIILRKNNRYVAERHRLIAAFPLLFGIIYFILYPLELDFMFFPTRLWQIGDVLSFCTIATMEACILTGMIPANRGYEILFSAVDLPAAIFDAAGEPVYQTVSARLPFVESENARIVSHQIQGGSVRYLADIGQVRSLNRQIEEAAHQIEARNAYIAEENRVKQEQTEIETKNHLYEYITAAVRPQLDQIDDILNTWGGGKRELARVGVLLAYIKRRSNMELLTEEDISVLELSLAVGESMDYVRLCGVNTATNTAGCGDYPALMMIDAYEQLEEITQACLDTLSDMIVTIRAHKQSLILRIMLRAEDFYYETKTGETKNSGFYRSVTITKDNEDIIIAITYALEGEGHE